MSKVLSIVNRKLTSREGVLDNEKADSCRSAFVVIGISAVGLDGQ